MRHEDRKFTATTVVLDGNEYVRCAFVDCTLSFAGGAYSLDGCSIDGAFTLELRDQAANTLHLMQMLASTEGGKAYIVSMLDPRNVSGGPQPENPGRSS